MMAKNTIYVPDYQRAYSWDTDSESSKSQKQVNKFLSDLEEYNKSNKKWPYYLGHFLFEENKSDLGIIDGQQRLTTIVIFLTILFRRLRSLRDLTIQEQQDYDNLIEAGRFSTVRYDKVFFDDYIINGTSARSGIVTKTKSAERIKKAHDFFEKRLSCCEESYCKDMLKNIKSARCTTHLVADRSEAIQMFVFQNSRGKKPSNLEIIKAQFMFNIHLLARDEKRKIYLLDKLNLRFEEIYNSISHIEQNVNEDNVLLYITRVHFNSLLETDVISKADHKLSQEEPLSFIEDFTESIHEGFMYLKTFYCEDVKNYHELHSIVTLGRIGIAMPFIIKAYKFDLAKDDLRRLCTNLESLLVRHRLIRTRAVMESRLKESFTNFSEKDSRIESIIAAICRMKQAKSSSDDWWYSYWSNDALAEAVRGGHINHQIAKFILWKYENHLESSVKGSYGLTRFDKIEDPELEHIAPVTENPSNGYDVYDQEFREQYLNCLGNYLLISRYHNRVLGNKPFVEKRASYKYLIQQRNIEGMTKGGDIWTKNHIKQRNAIIIEFITDHLLK